MTAGGSLLSHCKCIDLREASVLPLELSFAFSIETPLPPGRRGLLRRAYAEGATKVQVFCADSASERTAWVKMLTDWRDYFRVQRRLL
jgi:hypothetical protein